MPGRLGLGLAEGHRDAAAGYHRGGSSAWKRRCSQRGPESYQDAPEACSPVAADLCPQLGSFPAPLHPLSLQGGSDHLLF